MKELEVSVYHKACLPITLGVMKDVQQLFGYTACMAWLSAHVFRNLLPTVLE